MNFVFIYFETLSLRFFIFTTYYIHTFECKHFVGLMHSHVSRARMFPTIFFLQYCCRNLKCILKYLKFIQHIKALLTFVNFRLDINIVNLQAVYYSANTKETHRIQPTKDGNTGIKRDRKTLRLKMHNFSYHFNSTKYLRSDNDVYK